MLNSVFGGHFVFGGLFFGKKKLGRDIMNYHAKSQGSSLKIDRVMLNLVLGGHFVFWRKKLRRVIMNYHAKSGAFSLKID